MAEYKVAALTPAQAAEAWPHIRTYIEEALKAGALARAYEPTDILAHVLTDPSWRLWIAIDGQAIAAAIVTRIHQYDRCRTLNVLLVGGREMRLWLKQAMEATEQYARSIGCVAMEGGMRKGWAKVAGYKVASCVLIKEL